MLITGRGQHFNHMMLHQQRYLQVGLKKTVLLTYIGEWGLLPAVRILDNETKELRPWRELVDELRATDQVKQLWTDFQFVCKTAASYLNDITWTCCFEVCMQTYEKERKLRIHGHLFLRRPNSKIVLRGMEEMLKFHDTTPKPAEHLNKHTRSAAASWQGAFYCQCPKIGSVFSAGTIQPFTGYPVNGDWVFTLVQQEKIEYVDAKELIVRSGRAVGKRLQDLNALGRHMRSLRRKRMCSLLRSPMLQQIRHGGWSTRSRHGEKRIHGP